MTKTTVMKTSLLSSLLLALVLSPAAWSDEPEKKDAAGTDRAALEEKFAKMLTGATLVGHFTVTGAEKGSAPKEEKYTLTKVSKINGDLWLFQTRIQYGKNDATVPLPLLVKWAGDTAVITVDKVTIPKMGTFNARVLFSDGLYAGTWSHGKHGGHLFGRVDEAKEESAEPKKD